jgi:hypothetical protein
MFFCVGDDDGRPRLIDPSACTLIAISQYLAEANFNTSFDSSS